MELARTVAVVTPESTALEYEVAGPGSRFAALLVDTACQLAMLLLLAGVALLPLALWRGGSAVLRWTAQYVWPLAVGAGWLVLWGYYLGFELLWNGQTPGKRALGLRVIRDGGYTVEFGSSALRNVLRWVDLLPVVAPYLLGAVVMVSHRQGRRIGDLVAGTLVIRERPTPWVETLVRGDGEPEEAATARLPVAVVDRLESEELAVIAEFLRRRDGLPLDSRRELASRIAGSLCTRLGISREETGPASAAEDWLEEVHRAWISRHRRM